MFTAVGICIPGACDTFVDFFLIKRFNLPFLGQTETARLGGLLAEIAALLISTGCGWLALTWLTPLAQWLDQSGVWAVAIAAWPVARSWFELRKRREAV